MSNPPSPTCAHELRPGTVVCLHCRHAALEAAAGRRNLFLAKVGAVAALVAIVAGGGSMAWRGVRDAPSAPAAAAAVATLRTSAAPMVVVAERPAPAAAAPATPAPSPRSATPWTPGSAGPVIAEGRTPLRDGVVAVRTGDTVAVHFDTPGTRTRRMDKFERIVRETLPAVFGAVADSALGAVPAGTLVRGGDLLTELPTRGLHLPTAGGATLALWPATRPGRDGPLVVTYRATLLP